MSYVVQSVTTSDAPGVARAMFSAFWQDIHWQRLWATDMDLEAIIRDCAERLPWLLISGRNVKRHLKVVDTSSGEIVGYSRYIVPESHVGMWIDAQTFEPSPEEKLGFEQRFESVTDNGRIRGMNYAMLAEFGNPLDKVEKGILKESGPCFAVDYMSTHPAHKGHGVASMMLKEALKQVDAIGLKTIVMASPAGRGLYERQGFIFVCTLAQDYSKYGITEPYVHHWLLREPHK
ncbi:hypothetical protein LSUB1_G001937 [Lachnellula subtilissima]|uniref:N-acetyltransferase domain-containing protein n=1 Tax=Lachnellula subtilissima TaxID=602034 RepID=A0A8H8RWN8_9HELO|nr:hypothetical protein LSUB1_G001937 [Lachnellula subtilissima]